MNHKDALTMYIPVFDYYSEFRRSSFEEIISKFNTAPANTLMFASPFKEIEELQKLVKETNEFEIGIDYLPLPIKWKGPLDLSGVLRYSTHLNLCLYGHNNEFIYQNDKEIDILLRRIGVIGDKEGILAIIKGYKNEILYPHLIPYFSMHTHTVSGSNFPSLKDETHIKKTLENYAGFVQPTN